MQSRHLNLDAIDSIDAVDEENEDKDERNLHPILHFRYDWTFRDEIEHLPLCCEGHWDDECHE